MVYLISDYNLSKNVKRAHDVEQKTRASEKKKNHGEKGQYPGRILLDRKQGWKVMMRINN